MFQDSSIIIRIQKFLSNIHPFRFMSDEDLHDLCTHTDIGVYHANERIFSQDTEPKESFYIVKKGAVDIVDETENLQLLKDKCGEGDMFGLRPLLAESNYRYTAQSIEDTILYEIPLDKFNTLYKKYDMAVDFMLKRFAAGISTRETDKLFDSSSAKLIPTSLPIVLPAHKNLVVTDQSSSLGEAVKTMNAYGVSSIIITDNASYPIGIITDRDIRHIVATNYDSSVSVTEIMSSPVKTIPPNMLLQEVQLTMIESGLHHLCITEDGTANSVGLGMVTEHDILYASASDPIVILKKIKGSKSIQDLKECRNKIDSLLPNYLNDNLSKRITLSLIDRLNTALIRQTVHICLLEFNANNPKLLEESFCFYSMGSAARGEQLLMTDQDNGIIYIDELENRHSDFIALGKSINNSLHKVGYELCPADMMAGEQEWCKSTSQMKQLVQHWMETPGPDEILKTSIFFDFKFIYGNNELAEILHQTIKDADQSHDIFIRFLAKQAISNPPPLSFFRKFIIEKNGDYKDKFDIKLRAISPLSDCARVLALDEGYLNSTSTYDRYEFLKTVDPANALLYEEASEAYLDLLSIRLQFALNNRDSGRYIDIEKLDKLHRIHLRRTFVPTRQLIDMLERKYRLNYL